MKKPRINSCDVATPAPRNEAEIYGHMRDLIIKAHCAEKRGHKCCGAITITAEHITFNCKLCGDSRQKI